MQELIPTQGADSSKDTNKISYLQNLSSSIVNITDVFIQEEPILKQGGVTILSNSNILTINGQAKGYKSFLVGAITAASLGVGQLGLSGNGDSNFKVLYFDTEQAKHHVLKALQRIYKMSGFALDKIEPRLTAFALREYSPEVRLKIVEEVSMELSPNLIVIDGVKDLLTDFNNIEQSQKVVDMLMRLSANLKCGIVAVIHKNKALPGQKTNIRGMLGSMLLEKSETILEIEKNVDGIATVSSSFSRNEEIEPFSFRINKDALPELSGSPKTESKSKELEELMERCFFGTTAIDRKTLTQRIERVTGKKQKTAYTKIKQAEEAGVIQINTLGMYILTSDAEIPLPY